jgi:hypothetical protein
MGRIIWVEEKPDEDGSEHWWYKGIFKSHHIFNLLCYTRADNSPYGCDVWLYEFKNGQDPKAYKVSDADGGKKLAEELARWT